MAFTPEQQKAWRVRLWRKGICTRCHKKPCSVGSSICAKCKVELVADRQARLAQAREDGKCLDLCGRDAVDPPRGVRCDPCNDKRREARTATRHATYSLHRCASCGIELSPEGGDNRCYCLTCTEARNLQRRRRESL